MKNLKSIIFLLSLLPMFTANAWHDRTHIAMGLLAGYEMAYNLASPDVAKLKIGNYEGYNHYSNNSGIEVITKELVQNQIERYNKADEQDETGHLYGAIIGAIRAYQSDKRTGKYSEYNLAYLGHYLGDLSNPLHNTEYDEFNKKRHKDNDAVVENDINSYLQYIPVIDIEINSDNDIIDKVIQIANNSIKLGKKLRNEDRNMTKQEAYNQISQSASLFKGILKYLGK